MLLYADDQVLLANTEDELQFSIHHLNIIAQNFNMEISKTETKVRPFKVNYPFEAKFVLITRYWNK